MPAYRRAQHQVLEQRLTEPRRFIQVLTGPRQVGKTTLVLQTLGSSGADRLYVSADQPVPQSTEWLTLQWERGRKAAAEAGAPGAVLAIDEVQKLENWSEVVKRLWDEDTRSGVPLKVVILGSAPLLMQKGLTESLAGRFESLHLPHWSFREMRDAFGFTLEDYLWFGGYPGGASLIGEPDRWRRYVNDSLIEPTISRDVLLMHRVDKPILLRRLFELGCRYSGQILAYTKMLGQLHDAGNTTTLAHYLQLLSGAGMLTGLQKYSGEVVRQRASSPKLQVLDNALFSAMSDRERSAATDDPGFRGRLVESAVGCHLANAAAEGLCDLHYWRERDLKVDFVIRHRGRLIAIEVKSADRPVRFAGLEAFNRLHSPERALVVGADGVTLEEFLSEPVTKWFQG